MSIALFLLRSWDMYTVPFAAGTDGLAVIATLRPPANGHTRATASMSGITVRTKPWRLVGPSADDIIEVLTLRVILIEISLTRRSFKDAFPKSWTRPPTEQHQSGC